MVDVKSKHLTRKQLLIAKGRESKNVEDARNQPEPDANVQDFPNVPTARAVKKAMDANENVSNLVEKTPVKDWKSADPIDNIINTNNMIRSKNNRTRQETVFSHFTGPASQTPKMTNIKLK